MLLIDISSFPCGCCCVNKRCFRLVCRVVPVVSKDLRTKFRHSVLLPTSCCCCFSVLELLILLSFFFHFLMPKSASFQVLALTPQTVKLSCSRFTTTMAIILSNWLSIKISSMQSTGVPLMDPLLVMVEEMDMTSTYRITLSSTNLLIHLPGVALHTLHPPGIQLVTVVFSLEPYTLLLLTSKCSTK